MAKIRVLIADDDDIHRWMAALCCGHDPIVGIGTTDASERITYKLLDLLINSEALVHPEDSNVVRVDEHTINKAQDMILSCEGCDPSAEILFSEILDELTGSDHTVTDYLLKKPGRCPSCIGAVTETTLVRPA